LTASELSGAQRGLLATPIGALQPVRCPCSQPHSLLCSDKLRAELKYEIDKIQASQRLDLNLEKGRIRDELLSQNQKAAQTENRLDKEMTNMKTTLEANKNDIVRFAVGAIASTTAIGLGILRLLI
jgi:hypothetical protein